MALVNGVSALFLMPSWPAFAITAEMAEVSAVTCVDMVFTSEASRLYSSSVASTVFGRPRTFLEIDGRLGGEWNRDKGGQLLPARSSAWPTTVAFFPNDSMAAPGASPWNVLSSRLSGARIAASVSPWHH